MAAPRARDAVCTRTSVHGQGPSRRRGMHPSELDRRRRTGDPGRARRGRRTPANRIRHYRAVIALALLTFAPGGMGGSEEVVRTLTSSLAQYGRRDYHVLAPPDALDVANGLPVAATGAPGSSSRPVALVRAMTSGGALEGADVVHYPFTIPAPHTRRPHVVTLHDVLHLDLPELVPRAVRIFRLWAYDRAARKADRVIVPSAFVRD